MWSELVKLGFDVLANPPLHVTDSPSHCRLLPTPMKQRS